MLVSCTAGMTNVAGHGMFKEVRHHFQTHTCRTILISQLLLKMKLLCGIFVSSCSAAAANISAGACLLWHSSHACLCNCQGIFREDALTRITGTAMYAVSVACQLDCHRGFVMM